MVPDLLFLPVRQKKKVQRTPEYPACFFSQVLFRLCWIIHPPFKNDSSGGFQHLFYGGSVHSIFWKRGILSWAAVYAGNDKRRAIREELRRTVGIKAVLERVFYTAVNDCLNLVLFLVGLPGRRRISHPNPQWFTCSVVHMFWQLRFNNFFLFLFLLDFFYLFIYF